MTDLDVLIAFWESFLALQYHDPGNLVIKRVNETIQALEELKKLKGEE